MAVYAFPEIHSVPKFTNREGYKIMHTEITAKLRSKLNMELLECMPIRTSEHFHEISFVCKDIPENRVSALINALCFKEEENSPVTMPVVKRISSNHIAVLYKNIQCNLYTVQENEMMNFAAMYYSYSNGIKFLVAICRKFGIDLRPDGGYLTLDGYKGEDLGSVRVISNLRTLFSAIGMNSEVYRYEIYSEENLYMYFAESPFFSRELITDEFDAEFPGTFNKAGLLKVYQEFLPNKVDFEYGELTEIKGKIIRITKAESIIDNLVAENKAKRMITSVINATKFAEMLSSIPGFVQNQAEEIVSFFKARKPDLKEWLKDKTEEAIKVEVQASYEEWKDISSKVKAHDEFSKAMSSLLSPKAAEREADGSVATTVVTP